jgi:hypothetical protein
MTARKGLECAFDGARWHLICKLSPRDLVEMMAERGLPGAHFLTKFLRVHSLKNWLRLCLHPLILRSVGVHSFRPT